MAWPAPPPSWCRAASWRRRTGSWPALFLLRRAHARARARASHILQCLGRAETAAVLGRACAAVLAAAAHRGGIRRLELVDGLAVLSGAARQPAEHILEAGAARLPRAQHRTRASAPHTWVHPRERRGGIWPLACQRCASRPTARDGRAPTCVHAGHASVQGMRSSVRVASRPCRAATWFRPAPSPTLQSPPRVPRTY